MYIVYHNTDKLRGVDSHSGPDTVRMLTHQIFDPTLTGNLSLSLVCSLLQKFLLVNTEYCLLL
jgi:hypothetical protein